MRRLTKQQLNEMLDYETRVFAHWAAYVLATFTTLRTLQEFNRFSNEKHSFMRGNEQVINNWNLSSTPEECAQAYYEIVQLSPYYIPSKLVSKRRKCSR